MRVFPRAVTSTSGDAVLEGFGKSLLDLYRSFGSLELSVYPPHLRQPEIVFFFCFLLGNIKTICPRVSNELTRSSDVPQVCILEII